MKIDLLTMYTTSFLISRSTTLEKFEIELFLLIYTNFQQKVNHAISRLAFTGFFLYYRLRKNIMYIYTGSITRGYIEDYVESLPFAERLDAYKEDSEGAYYDILRHCNNTSQGYYAAKLMPHCHAFVIVLTDSLFVDLINKHPRVSQLILSTHQPQSVATMQTRRHTTSILKLKVAIIEKNYCWRDLRIFLKRMFVRYKVCTRHLRRNYF